MLSLCLSISVPSQHFSSPSGSAFPLSQPRGKERRLTFSCVAVCRWRLQVFADVSREETSFKALVLAPTTLQLNIAPQDRSWHLEDKVGLGLCKHSITSKAACEVLAVTENGEPHRPLFLSPLSKSYLIV